MIFLGANKSQHATAHATVFFITDRRDVTEGNYSNAQIESTKTNI